MLKHTIDVVTAGHICIDIIPELISASGSIPNLYVPGELIQTGPITFSLGGSVANTGAALCRLGANVRAMGKIGDDALGQLVLDLLRTHGDLFLEYMAISPGEATSYSIVLSVSGVDRCFLHCPGVNNTFMPSDVNLMVCRDARILHFGYPPLMQRILEDSGRGLATLFEQAQSAGTLTSLDMAMPPDTIKMTSTDWRAWLREVLPYVDLFFPSFDEITRMLSRDAPNACCDGKESEIDPDQLKHMADELLELGAKIVVIKLGTQGLYLQTNQNVLQLSKRKLGSNVNWQSWLQRQLIAPCYKVEAVSSTGAGDCTIAGFLMAILNGMEAVETLNAATKVGAYSVQSLDAASNIPTWQVIQNSMRASRQKCTSSLPRENWKLCSKHQVYYGLEDASLR